MSHELIKIHLAIPQQVEQTLESSLDRSQFSTLVQWVAWSINQAEGLTTKPVHVSIGFGRTAIAK